MFSGRSVADVENLKLQRMQQSAPRFKMKSCLITAPVLTRLIRCEIIPSKMEGGYRPRRGGLHICACVNDTKVAAGDANTARQIKQDLVTAN
jgi:hypothetical protein